MTDPWDDEHPLDEGPQSVDLEELGEDGETDMVPCPNCGELVYAEADRCPRCGEWVTIRLDQGTHWAGGWWWWVVLAVVLLAIAAYVLLR